MDKSELLKRYAQSADQEAFGEVVRDHGSWLFSAARRQLGDEHLAEDVTQAVFLLLTKRARRLGRYRYVSGWLFLALENCVKHAKRDRARLARREKEAASMRKEAVEEAGWEEIAPELEEAVGKLGKADREAVLLRFYEQRPLVEVGRALGISEEAARKRVERAVEKLRGMLEKKGISGTTAGLSAVLVGNVVREAPASLVEGVMRAVGGGNPVASAIARGAMRLMRMATLKVAALVVAVMALAGVLAVQAQSGGAKVAAGGPSAEATLPSVPATPLRATTNPVLDAILKRLSAHQERLTNLKIEAEYSARRIDDGQVTMSATGTCWIIPVVGSKIRFDTEVTEPGKGTRKWTNSYDGRARYDFLQEPGVHPVGVLKRERLAVVDAPKFGWSASIYGCFDAQGYTFTQLISNWQRHITISQESEEDRRYEVVTISNGSGQKKWVFWLDRDREYALKRRIDYREAPGGKQETLTMDVKEFQEAAPNAYYPSHVVWTGMGSVVDYRATSIVANDPTFDDAVFTFQWPVGTVVNDEFTGKGVVIGATPDLEGDARKARLKAGDVAPDFAVKTLNGKEFRLADHRGKYVLLDFWAISCGPCVTDMSYLKKVYEQFGQNPRFVMIGLNLDEQIQAPADFVKKNGISWSQGFLGGWAAGEKWMAPYGVRGIPAIFLIGPDGKVIAKGLIGAQVMTWVENELGKAAKNP